MTTPPFDPPRVTVFCGSARGHDPRHADAARVLADALLRRGLGVVTGGGHVGLMGVLADAVLAGGGEAHGVIPRRLFKKEVAHEGLTRLHVVETMHERKALLGLLGGAFVALPGGMGTLEELFEVLTWSQLGYHGKPIGLLDVAGYYRPLEAFLDHAVVEGFLRPEHRALLVRGDDPDALLEELARGPGGAASGRGATS